MFGFEYKFITSFEIFESITLISEYSLIDFVILFVGILIILGFVIYIIPIIYIYMNNKSEVSKKKKNMHIIRKMVLLRDMEDEIAKELKLK